MDDDASCQILSSDSEKDEEEQQQQRTGTGGAKRNADDDGSYRPDGDDEDDQSTESGGIRARKKLANKRGNNNANMAEEIADKYVKNILMCIEEKPDDKTKKGRDEEGTSTSIEILSERGSQILKIEDDNGRIEAIDEQQEQNDDEEEAEEQQTRENQDNTNGNDNEQQNDQNEEQQQQDNWQQRNMHKIYNALRFDKPGPRFESAGPSSSLAAGNEDESIAKRRVKRKRTVRVPFSGSGQTVRQLHHNGKGHLVLPNGDTFDLCDCLDKECAGCNYPCKKCDSRKCSYECRKNRKTCIESIDVLGGDKTLNPFLPKKP